ncbi:MAG: hypothetical protein Kow00108_10650 [Calditrichia bacterium]
MGADYDEKMIEELIKENKFLKAKLKREHQLAEQANMELVQMNIEAETKSQELKRANEKLKKHFMETISIISRIIELKSPGYEKHARRVAKGCLFLGKKLNLDEDQLHCLEVSALIHEIGKVGIPEHLMKKKSEELTKEEILLIHSHPVLGESVFEGLSEFENIGKTIRHMRENFDGSGRPDRLVGDDIPLGSRILAIVETFDTYYMRRGREYPVEKIYNALIQKSDTCFDPRLVELFEDFVLTHYAGKSLDDRKIIPLDQLEEGMVVSKNVRTLNNILLVPKGATLSAEIIEKIRRYATHEPLTHVEVFKQ